MYADTRTAVQLRKTRVGFIIGFEIIGRFHPHLIVLQRMLGYGAVFLSAAGCVLHGRYVGKTVGNASHKFDGAQSGTKCVKQCVSSRRRGHVAEAVCNDSHLYTLDIRTVVVAAAA